MGFEQTGPTPVAEDNIACIYMSKSSGDVPQRKAHRRACIQASSSGVCAGRHHGIVPRADA
eukprot:610898-Rhodomonas_salina.1